MPKQQKEDPLQILASWTERDLTADAAAGLLPRAHEVDDIIDQVSDLIDGGRHPILTGDPGVGKTAVIMELARRIVEGRAPARLAGRRIIQFSFRRKAASLQHPHLLVQHMEKLTDAMASLPEPIVPFFSDMDAAYRLGLESQLQALPYRCKGPVLGEGSRSEINSMFEDHPELQQQYAAVAVEEPTLDRTQRLLAAWCAEQEEREQHSFTPDAQKEAIYLTHRFLSRQHMPRKALDLLSTVGALKRRGDSIRDVDVLERFCSVQRVPRWLVDPAVPFDLAEMESQFAHEVLGQPEAVSAVVGMIGVIKAGLSDLRRPFGAFLFVGPTGVGKTHVAQLLARTLFGSRDRVVRLNMADYQTEQAAMQLFGDPNGYPPPAQRGVLTFRVSGHPFAVLLLDEFEKAHVSVHDRFMQLIDEGSFINAKGESISCRSMIVIATSNAGAEVYRSHAFGFTGRAEMEEKDREIDRRLEEHFRFEFLNRFDRVVHFHPLSRADIRTVALRELEQLRQRSGLEQRRIELEVDEAVLDWLAVNGYDPDYGARFLRRTIERHITTALADAIVREQAPPGSRVVLTVRNNAIAARIAARPRAGAGAGGAAGAGTPKIDISLGGRMRGGRACDEASLLEYASTLLARSERRLRALAERVEERSRLAAMMADPEFWNNKDERQRVVDRFRTLDVAVHTEERLAAPIVQLREALAADADARSVDELRRLGHIVERAEASIAEWDARLAEEGAALVWMIISNADPLAQAEDWVEELVHMQLAWAARMHLHARTVAYEVVEGRLARAVLEVEGPGAASILAMEAGFHRQRRPRQGDCRALIEIIPRDARSESAHAVEPANTMQKRRPRLDLAPEYCARLAIVGRGINVELLGEDKSIVASIIADLEHHWSTVRTDTEVARIYGEDGSARDPRTETGIVYKEAMRGRLDKLLDAWRERSERDKEGDDRDPAEPADPPIVHVRATGDRLIEAKGEGGV